MLNFTPLFDGTGKHIVDGWYACDHYPGSTLHRLREFMLSPGTEALANAFTIDPVDYAMLQNRYVVRHEYTKSPTRLSDAQRL